MIANESGDSTTDEVCFVVIEMRVGNVDATLILHEDCATTAITVDTFRTVDCGRVSILECHVLDCGCDLVTRHTIIQTCILNDEDLSRPTSI